MKNPPLIGVTGPDRGGFAAWLMTAFALRRAGATPVRITPTRPSPGETLDGFVIGGGTDVDPFHYGEEPEEVIDRDSRFSPVDWLVGLLLFLPRILLASHSAQSYDPDRDHMEQHLITHALYNDKPLLGICRGAQLMNVTLGGTLYQKIDHFYTEGTANVRSVLPRKTVDVTEQSLLAQVLSAETCRVNALHEQCIKSTGSGIVVSAREPSGVIQAIEKSDEAFAVGVQWHPEYMPQSVQQQRLFHQLVRTAAGRGDA